MRLSPVLTLLSCNGSICVLAFSLSSGLAPLKEFDIAVPAVRKYTETLLCLFVTHLLYMRSFLSFIITIIIIIIIIIIN